MKKLISLILAAVLSLPLYVPASATGAPIAVSSTQTVPVDGKPVTFETYALLDANGYMTNYAKLRDVAYVLNGTAAQFSVGWSADRGIFAETGKPYEANGSEMHTPYSGNRAYTPGLPTTDVNGAAVALDAIVLNDDAGGGYTYYKLRDLGQALGFVVDWSAELGVTINTGSPISAQPDSVLTAQEISSKCSPAAFLIEIYGFNGALRGTGSGFFISADGLAVTNFHVAANSCKLVITTKDGKKYEDVKVIDVDEDNDLALLRVSGGPFPFLELGDSSKVSQGQTVYAIGSPRGLEDTMSQGIVSNAKRTLDGVEYIQISVPIAPGSSGGALLDQQGKVIGVTSAGYNSTGDLNLAIPANRINALDKASAEPLVLWQESFYPGFQDAYDFGVFSGVKLIDFARIPLGYIYKYDAFDFREDAGIDAGDCYADTIFLYTAALEQKGFALTEVVDENTYSGTYETATEQVYFEVDLHDTRAIWVMPELKAHYYKDFPSLPDLGWYLGIEADQKPDSMDTSLMYGYKWSPYFTYSDFMEEIELYCELLEDLSYEKLYEKDKTYFYRGNGLDVFITLTDTEVYCDVFYTSSGGASNQTPQEAAYNDLSAWITQNANTTVTNQPAYEMWSDSDTCYVVIADKDNVGVIAEEYLDDGGVVRLIFDLLPDEQTSFCSYTFKSPSQSYLNFDGSYKTANSLVSENMAFTFKDYSGNASQLSEQTTLAKYLLLSGVEFVDYLFKYYVAGNHSIGDFGFTRVSYSGSTSNTSNSSATVTPPTTQPVSTYAFPLHLYSNDGKEYLGKLTTNKYDSDSIWNTYGTYGSKYNSKSIWNTYSTYGSAYSNESAFNKYASKPPKIVDNNGKFFGYLTANEYKVDGYTIEQISQYLKNNYQ